jgi:pimeloyl-ACP methyl ester carboxylesterase
MAGLYSETSDYTLADLTHMNSVLQLCFPLATMTCDALAKRLSSILRVSQSLVSSFKLLIAPIESAAFARKEMKARFSSPALILVGVLPLVATYPAVQDFNWSTIDASTTLSYSPCYNNTHKCAKLTVPRDWLNTSNPKRVTLAIITRPAKVAESDPAFGGTIIVNPGGPSGSGVEFVLRAGETLQRTSSSETHQFEILSFDPRGVGLTEPVSDCHRDEFARGSGILIQRGLGAPDEGDHVVRRLMSLADAFGDLCLNGAEGDDDIKNFMSTSSVARDMVEIVDQLALIPKGIGQQETMVSAGVSEQTRLELRSEADPTPRINYWGFSYGTVLGNYFASMFPGRVGRIALEGVVDVEDYYAAVSQYHLAHGNMASSYLLS